MRHWLIESINKKLDLIHSSSLIFLEVVDVYCTHTAQGSTLLWAQVASSLFSSFSLLSIGVGSSVFQGWAGGPWETVCPFNTSDLSSGNGTFSSLCCYISHPFSLSSFKIKSELKPQIPISSLELHTDLSFLSSLFQQHITSNDDDCFYIALFSALEQTHCARMWCYMSK